MTRLLIILIVPILVVACRRADEGQPSGSGFGATTGSSAAKRPTSEQIKPPLDLKNPPGDATKTASGLIYKKLASSEAGPAIQRNDTVLVTFTGWDQQTGETFYTSRALAKPQPLNLTTAAPGFTEGLQGLKKGEKAILWMPPQLGYRGTPPPGAGTRIYEVEIVDIVSAPATPADLQQAPADAQTTKSGAKYVVVKPGTGADKARSFDSVSFRYSAWDASGRMFDSNELKKAPTMAPPFKQSPPLEEVLTTMVAGQRDRFWVDSKAVQTNLKALATPPTGLLIYEVEVISIDKGTAPPPAPPDVARPPGDAQTTAKGLAYKLIKAGKGGPKPKTTDSVKIHATGWTTDGRMFESSLIRNMPNQLNLTGGMEGWTEAIPLMSVGDKYRFWIPEKLAYKGAPNLPQGMLVYDVELVEIVDPAKARGHGDEDDGHGHGKTTAKIPAPPDVAKPPPTAKKTAKGVSYRVLNPGKGGPKPTTSDTVKVHYTGWSTDGVMFDSSVTKGTPAEFRLTGVIAGWTDVLQQMSAGDKLRVWIPEELAYKGQAGRPQGMLVFDIELLEINPQAASPH